MRDEAIGDSAVVHDADAKAPGVGWQQWHEHRRVRSPEWTGAIVHGYALHVQLDEIQHERVDSRGPLDAQGCVAADERAGVG